VSAALSRATLTGNFLETSMISALDAQGAANGFSADDVNAWQTAAGIFLVSAVPALFWTAVVLGVGHYCGTSFTMPVLATVFGAIALFLAAVCAPLMTRI
jgi:hypothetical protein